MLVCMDSVIYSIRHFKMLIDHQKQAYCIRRTVCWPAIYTDLRTVDGTRNKVRMKSPLGIIRALQMTIAATTVHNIRR